MRLLKQVVKEAAGERRKRREASSRSTAGVQKRRRQGRGEQRGEAYIIWYVEPLTEARTKLAAFFNTCYSSRMAP